MDTWAAVAHCTLGFVSGSIPFGYLLARSVGVDVRLTGSGNIGATNVTRAAGAWLGILTLAGDVAKGALPTWAAQLSEPTSGLAAWVALAAVLGHIFCPWLRFRGGKGVATAAGAMAVVAPRALGVALILFLLVAWTTRYVSLASIVAAIGLPVFCLLSDSPATSTCVALALAGLITWRHRTNLGRLLEGSEPKFGRQGNSAFLKQGGPGSPGRDRR